MLTKREGDSASSSRTAAVAGGELYLRSIAGL